MSHQNFLKQKQKNDQNCPLPPNLSLARKFKIQNTVLKLDFFEGFSNTVTKIKQKHEEEEDDDQNANTRETVKQTFLRFVLFWVTWHKYIPSLENPG